MHKKIIKVNLASGTCDVETSKEYNKYLGGVGLGLALLRDHIAYDPIIFSTGPLNGFFPYAAKTSIVLYSGGVVEDLYLGGTLSNRLKFADIDSLIIEAVAPDPVIINIHDDHITLVPYQTDIDSLGLPGKRTILKPIGTEFVADEYFFSPENYLSKKLLSKNVAGLVVTGTQILSVPDFDKYASLYTKILGMQDKLLIEKGVNPSCSNCPMGCSKSRVGELGGNVLTHSLVACAFAESIYTNINLVFSCLNSLGYDYTHENLETLPKSISEVLADLT